MSNKVVVNGQVEIERRVSKKGNEYQMVVLVVGNRRIDIGFLDTRAELALLKAGVKF